MYDAQAQHGNVAYEAFVQQVRRSAGLQQVGSRQVGRCTAGGGGQAGTWGAEKVAEQ
jgi:hypothetical protein